MSFTGGLGGSALGIPAIFCAEVLSYAINKGKSDAVIVESFSFVTGLFFVVSISFFVKFHQIVLIFNIVDDNAGDGIKGCQMKKRFYSAL